MLTSRIPSSLSILLCSLMVAANATAQNSRAVTAASYVDHGNSWYAKGQLDKAIGDYNLALEFDPGSGLAYSTVAVPGRQRKSGRGDSGLRSGHQTQPASRRCLHQPRQCPAIERELGGGSVGLRRISQASATECESPLQPR